MKASAFAYDRATSVANALELLSTHGEKAKVLSGGQSLLAAMNLRLIAPELVVDIGELAELRGIAVKGNVLTIGALTRHADLLKSSEIAAHAPLLKRAVAHVAHPAIRNRGTIGGSLAQADPASELPACMLALGATIIDQYDDDTSSDPITTTTSTMIEYGAGNWTVGMENADPARPSPSPQPSPFPPPAGMSPTPRPYLANYAMLNRPFRNVGEFGYALRPEGIPAPKTVDFFTAASADSAILDLFTYNTASVRAGTVSLNTANPAVIAAILRSAITAEDGSSSPVTLTQANNAAAQPTPAATTGMIGHPTLGTSVQPAVGKNVLPRLVAAAGTSIGSTEEQKETVARALSEVTQTRTWGLFIDVIAQSGRYPPTAAALKDFVVEGEKRYWLHVAIDRFTGEVIDQQLEAVEE